MTNESPSNTDAAPASLPYATRDAGDLKRGAADLLTIGFGTTVAMWGAGYLARLFGPVVPAPVIFALLLLLQLLGGFTAGRYSDRGARGGALAGLITGALNLLIVGSLLTGDTPNEIKRGALLYVPGTLAISAVLGAIGAAIGRACGPRPASTRTWHAGLPTVAVAAAFLLLGAGGVVTGFDEGLAVVDWPNTEGYNMFLYPLARMTGGVYLEHSHRLLGSLVGLTTLVLTIHILRTDQRRYARRTAWGALAMVIVQGILGGLRVTGVFTLSADPADTDPSVVLAIVHGIFGQLVFCALVVLAVMRWPTWHTAGPPAAAPAASTDRFFGVLLLLLLFVQLVLGTLVRHFTWALRILPYGLETEAEKLETYGQWALHLHITVAVLIALLAVAVGIRAWGLYRDRPALPLLGSSLLVLAAVQLVLGIGALIVTGDDSPTRRAAAIDVAVTTVHQVVGAAILGVAAALLIWNYRLLTTTAAPETAATGRR